MSKPSNWPVPFVLIAKDAVVRDGTLVGRKNKLRSPGNNGRKVAAIRCEPDPPFSEEVISEPAWRVPSVLPTGEGGLEIATFTEFSRQDRHKHEKSIEIYTVLKGAMGIHLNDEGPYTLREGDEIVILPGTVHQILQGTPRPGRPPPAPSPVREGVRGRGEFDLLVRVHAIACHGSLDKYVQLSRNGDWRRWDTLSKEERRGAYRK